MNRNASLSLCRPEVYLHVLILKYFSGKKTIASESNDTTLRNLGNLVNENMSHQN